MKGNFTYMEIILREIPLDVLCNSDKIYCKQGTSGEVLAATLEVSAKNTSIQAGFKKTTANISLSKQY